MRIEMFSRQEEKSICLYLNSQEAKVFIFLYFCEAVAVRSEPHHDTLLFKLPLQPKLTLSEVVVGK